MKFAARLILCCILTSTLCAETFSLAPQSSNAQVMSVGGNYTAASVRVGVTGSGSFGCAAIYSFAMPKLAFGDVISSATFSLNVAALKGSGFTFNGDLYSLGTSASNVVLANADYFQGAFGTDPNAVPLQSQFLTPATPVGRASANASGNAAIAADLQKEFTAGATQGSYYFVRLNPDFSTATNSVLGWNVSLQQDIAANQPSLSITTSPPAQKGRVLIEYWSGITGWAVTSLTSNANYPNKPSAREYSTVMEIPQSLDENSGTRLRGFFYPPTSGSYTFAVAGDDEAILLMSTDSDPLHATTIASVASGGWTSYQQWNKYPSQTSATISLTAGKAYYIEARHKQGTGGSHISVGYKPPGGSAIALMPATNVVPADGAANYSAGAIAATISQAHPRLMLSPAALKRISATITASGTLPATWWATVQTKSNTILGQSVIVPTAGTNFISAARDLQDRVYNLSLDYLLNSDPVIKTNCLNKIYAELQSAANWGGANNNTAPGNWNKYQFLDVPEMVHAYAIAYDWCHAGWTADQKTFLLNTLVTQGLVPGITAYGPPTANYLNGVGNWTIICDTGLILGALAVLGDETASPKAPTILDNLLPALFNSPAMAEWGPDGGWPEAPTYGAFAMRYLSTFLASLETATGSCFNFDKLSGLSAAGSAPLYITGPLMKCFNYADENLDSAGQDMVPGVMYFGLKYNQPVYSWCRQQFGCGHPTDLIWYDARGAAATPWSLNLPTSTSFRNAGAIILRSAWNNTNALFAGLRTGFNPSTPPYGSGHQQLEIGSFVLDALGTRWAMDLGRDSYNGAYFVTTPSTTVPNRWQYYRCRAEGNNTLVINPGRDGGQALNGTSTILNFKSTANPNLQQAVIDMSPIYAADMWGSPTVTTSAKRGLRFVTATNSSQMVAQLQDEVATTSTTSVSLNWFMHTATTITLSGNTATLSSGNNRLLLTIRSPASAVFKSMAAVPFASSPDAPNYPNSPLPGPEIPNTGINKLWIEYAIPSGTQSTTIKVDMCPYVQGSTVPVAPTAPALSGW